MEKLKIFILFALFFGFAACENDEDKMYINESGQIGKPVLSIDGPTDIEVEESTVGMVPAIIKWTKSDFGTDILVEYTLEVAATESFADPISVATVGNDIYVKALTASDLSEWAVDHFDGLDDNGKAKKTDFYLRIAATMFLENPTVTVPPETKYSNSIKLSVLPFYIPPEFPKEIYMIGDEFGGWDWNSDGVVEMVPVHSNDGHFWAIRYLTAGKGFKWNSRKSNTDAFYSLGTDFGFMNDGENAYVGESGLYMIYVDAEKGKISIETPKVYGMGDCFGGWDVATYPFSVDADADGKTMSITTAKAGELRMYAASDISPVGSDWWKMEFIIFGDVITYRGTGNDQDRVPVGGGVKVTLDFNAGTGTIK